ncbi:MAG: hypothetical protein CL624_10790 [Arcobacter sp.]|nr:hypothetical protein [Arcobacter sp.]|tara:strand:+ start:219 stop:2300 length:2082 start_codon:yes stop_codon:yes gene_type:complete
MKKFFISLTILIIFIIGAVYGVLFTKSGNNFVASYIENKVNDEQKDVQLKVNDFTLTFNTINFNATISDNSNINIVGDLAIFKKKVDLKYDIKINELGQLENLIKQKLNGPFSTSGTFKGDANFSVIKGISSIAQSETSYDLKLVDFEAKNINVLMKNARIEKLLHLLNQKDLAKGNLSLKGDIKDANLSTLDGKVSVNISKGKLNNQVINKDFNQNISSPIYFKSDIHANLSPNKATIKSDLITSIVDLFANKTEVLLDSGKILSDYKLDVKNLQKLEGIIGTKLYGNFITSGNVVMNNGIIKVDGNSNIFDSLTNYSVKLADSAPEYIKFNIANAKIDKLLHILNEPVYADGILNIDGNITDAKAETLAGVIKTQILNGRIINPVANTVFKQNLKKKITFKGNSTTTLVPNQAITNSKITTTLANLDIKDAVFTFNDAAIDANYLLNIPSLANLYDVTSTKMRGAVSINGNMKNKNKSLQLTGNSKLLGGVLDFNLKNDDLHADIKNVQIKELTNMLYYPDVFDSTTALTLDYNMLMKKGKLKGTLLKGHFLPNNFSTLLNQFAKFDITREVYETVDINTNINKLVLSSTVNMKSKNTQIDVTKSILDLEKSTIDALINTKIKNTQFALKVKGTTTKPKISLDSKDLISNQVNKQIDKNKEKIKEKLNKVLKGKLGEDGAEQILKNFKSLF